VPYVPATAWPKNARTFQDGDFGDPTAPMERMAQTLSGEKIVRHLLHWRDGRLQKQQSKPPVYSSLRM
jgi:hypothetical protein